MIGIKGTGMARLAVALHRYGAVVSGSDTSEVFYTDELLERSGVPYHTSFHRTHLPIDCTLVIVSPAYIGKVHPELDEALRRGLRILSYVEVLSSLSELHTTYAVAGTHGKSSVSAMIDHLLDCSGTAHLSLYGTSYLSSRRISDAPVPDADPVLVLEACEYRDHFLRYHPDCIILTSAAHDHPDYFPDRQAVIDSFVAFIQLLPANGVLICQTGDAGVREVCARIASQRSDIRQVPYGRGAPGAYGIAEISELSGRTVCTAANGECFTLSVPGAHMAENMCAALAATAMIEGPSLSDELRRDAVRSFLGSIRRSQWIGQAGGVIVVDDYAHHPDEISVTIDGLRTFYRPSRVIVDFIPHTFSRTLSLFEEFVCALDHADAVVIHPVFATVREQAPEGMSAQGVSSDLARRLRCGHAPQNDELSWSLLMNLLKPGDLFITMGAGNNHRYGSRVLQVLRERE